MSVVTYTYNRQQQRIGMTDQNGTVHAYDYDKLARQTADRVTTAGTGVNTDVLRIEQTYDVRGLLEHVTSYSAASGGSVVNDVLRTYNDFMQLQVEYQEHTGSVNTSTSPKVEYAYADGGANTIRPTRITYPDGGYLEYLYGSAGDAADRLSRIETINSGGTDDICQYTYLGLSTFVQADYLLSSIRWDLATGSGANPYAGLDAFGRVIDCLWQQYSGPTDLARLKYGYNRDSSRQWREDAVASSGFDELYAYDALQRLIDMERGDLNMAHDAISSPTLGQDWTLDPTGNWDAFNVSVTGALAQSRDSNTLNQITDITETSGTAWATPAYNSAGNMTSMPRPNSLDLNYFASYDAWNRLRIVRRTATQLVNTYFYDGLNRRVTNTANSTVRHYYYSDQWQVVEERVGTATVPNKQYFWGLRHVDDLVLRGRDSSGGGSLDEYHYAMQDANWNVVAIYNLIASSLDERYAYTPYGVVQFLNASFGAISSSTYDWTYLFTGRERDTESGLQINRMRYLHPPLGCWVTADPIGYDAGEMNLYRYITNTPPNAVDPIGTWQIAKDPTGEPCTAKGSEVKSRVFEVALFWANLKTDPGTPRHGLDAASAIKKGLEILDELPDSAKPPLAIPPDYGDAAEGLAKKAAALYDEAAKRDGVLIWIRIACKCCQESGLFGKSLKWQELEPVWYLCTARSKFKNNNTLHKGFLLQHASEREAVSK